MEIRTATPTDVAALSRTLARAFEDDPVMHHLIPRHGRRRSERLATFMAMGAKGAVADGTAYTTGDLSGAAVWRRPGHPRTPPAEMVRGIPTILGVLGRRAPVGMAVLRTIEDNHPEEPHWYLQILGTEPAEQGRGIGAALMAPVLEQCDAEGVPAYLESSKERNVPYYERYGFRVTEELHLPKGGPPLWPMWRDPRPGG